MIPLFPFKRTSSRVVLIPAKLGNPSEVNLLLAKDSFLSDVRALSVDDGNEVSWLSLNISEFKDLRVDRCDKEGEVRLLCDATSALNDLTEASS